MSRVEKPWGFEFPIEVYPELTYKLLYLIEGGMTSWHYHKKKQERFIVVDGTAYVFLREGEMQILEAGDSMIIEPMQVHRVWCPFDHLIILEEATQQFGDVHRVEDKYGRG